MAIQLTLKMTHKSPRMARLKNYIRSPIKPYFIVKVKQKLRENIRDASDRPLPFHTYPSDHEGNLESSIFVEKQGASELILGSYVPYAYVLEFGRPMMRKYGKRSFVFQGYYPNPSAVRSALNIKRYNPTWLSASMSEFHGRIVGGRRYKENLSPEKMRKQNVRFITKDFEGDIAEMKWSKGKIYGKGRHARTMLEVLRRRGSNLGIPGGEPTGTKRRTFLPKSIGKTIAFAKVRASLPYGIYTVFTKKTKRIAPYHVFSKTAEWAKDELISDVKSTIRKIDTEYAT